MNSAQIYNENQPKSTLDLKIVLQLSQIMESGAPKIRSSGQIKNQVKKSEQRKLTKQIKKVKNLKMKKS